MNEKVYDGLVRYEEELQSTMYTVSDETKLTLYHNRLMDVVDRLQTIHHSEMEAYDREQRRELEQKKIELEAEIERLKTKFDWGKAGVDIAKVLIPVVISSGVYIVTLGAVHDIEKFGHLVTKTGNVVLNKGPNLMWK